MATLQVRRLATIPGVGIPAWKTNAQFDKEIGK
jgi:hypothetical protein